MNKNFRRIKNRIFKYFRQAYYQIRQTFLLRQGAVKIHCLGDSHLINFEYIAQRNYFHNTIFDFCIVQGATAMGLPNPGSKTQAGPIFERYRKQIKNNNYILFCMGEVDCGYVIWYRSQKYKISTKAQFEQALENYTSLIQSYESIVGKKILICSTPLPTIQDGQDWGEVANLRKEVKATLRMRTDLTLQFNQKMREFSIAKNYQFLDIESHILNPVTKLVDKKFLNHNSFDHHLDSQMMTEVILAVMSNNGFN